MNRRLTVFIVTAVILVGAFSSTQTKADPESVLRAPETYSAKRPTPVLTLGAWGIFDPRTGEVIAGERTDRVLPIASITKLFTAYAVRDLDMSDEPIVINWSDLYTEGRAGNLSYGETYTARELLFPMLLESSNDASAALRRTMGDGFERSIDALKTRLALNGTTIADASGLSPKNTATVADLATFYALLLQSEQYLLQITRVPLYANGTSDWMNNNPLRTFPGFLNGKHGFTDEAQRTYIGTFSIADGVEVGIVMLGSSDLRRDAEEILAYAKARMQ